MKKIALLLILSFCQIHILFAQKRALEHADFDQWNNLTGRQISNDGNWISYHITPPKGDATLKLMAKNGQEAASFERAKKGQLSWEAQYLPFLIKAPKDTIDALRRKKTKKNKLPKDTLAIYNIKKKSLHKIPGVSNFRLPAKWDGYLTYQLEAALPPPKDTSNKEEQKTKKKLKKVSKTNGYHIVVLNLKTLQEDTLKYVLHYQIAPEGKSIIYHTTGIDSLIEPGVYYYDIQKQKRFALAQGKGKYYQLSIDRFGKQAAFVADWGAKSDQIRNFQLCYWKSGMDTAIVKAKTGSSFLPKDWIISQHGNLYFSYNSKRLYFGTAMPPIIQDTTLLPEEIIQVEIWNHKNGRLHTQQKVELERDKKKSFQAVYDITNDQFYQLAQENMPIVRIANKGDADWALGLSYLPYEKYITWEGFPRRMDVYLINIKTGTSKMVIEDIRGSASISALGKYLYWYHAADSVWYSYDNKEKNIHALTRQIPHSMGNELNDVPNYPYQYGIAGWTAGDQQLLIYDRFDLWQVDPTNSKKPINLTNGRANNLRFRYKDLDRENPSLDANMLLHVYNEKSREEGFYSLTLGESPKKLLLGDFKFRTNNLIKARNSKTLIYTKENNEIYPDILCSDLTFAKSTTISTANPQIKDFKWCSIELHQWTSLDGVELEGLLYKPDNFDPKKKYPMMVYFYERYSDRLHHHQGVVPHRSIINPVFYASRGYLVFIPDIVYRDGYPGESCYNAVVPGVTSLIDQGFVDKDRIGVQGHSWGGYQVAYLVTKTNIFRAAESGAPVSNMISAYGGIRWGSGYSRMFQYEHTQSRIGGTLWQYPMRFIENSPIFYMDKVQTPLLIMHNDKDGHVPWYQGIEMYMALRRLGKPAWMLNYNGEPHWPTSWQNKRDFNIRMQQFFDYYLLDTAIPKWMDQGIPAMKKGIDDGLELKK